MDRAFTEIESKQLREAAASAMAAHTKASLRLAKTLFEICYGTVRLGPRTVPLVEAWGHGDFDEYVEHELLMHVTPARALVETYDELCVKRNLPEGTLPHSIAALKLLARLSRGMDDRTFLKWVARAKELSACEFAHEADKHLYTGGRGRAKTVGFSLQWNQASAVLKRIREARAELGVGTNGDALAKIIDEWSEARSERARTLRRVG